MLSRKICLICWHEALPHIDKTLPEWEEGKHWVMCPKGGLLSHTDDAPKECPYKLEHLMRTSNVEQRHL